MHAITFHGISSQGHILANAHLIAGMMHRRYNKKNLTMYTHKTSLQTLTEHTDNSHCSLYALSSSRKIVIIITDLLKRTIH